MIDSIAREINQHYRTFKEHVLIKVSDENEHVSYLYQGYEQNFFPGTTKNEFAALYSQAIIFRGRCRRLQEDLTMFWLPIK